MGTPKGYLPRPAKAARVLAQIAAALMLSACAQSGLGGADQTASLDPRTTDIETSSTRSELEKATEYWGKEYGKDPRSKKAALSYARNLKALNQRQAALAVLQQASVFHAADREVASEYGRLALELDQVNVALKLLAYADDPARPDWRVISARGAAHAKQGQYAEAIPFFERANTLAGGNPSVLNNLALAYAASGQADRGEALLRQALEGRPDDAKIRQNLGIVLSLQGRHEEAKQLAASGPDSADGKANVETMRQIVKSEVKPQVAAPALAQAQRPAASAAPSRTLSDREADEIIRKAIAASADPAKAAPAVAGWKKDQSAAAGKPQAQ